MSSSLTLARPYARAAFALARESGRLQPWSDLLNFAATVASDARVQALLGHPKLVAADAVGLLLPPGDTDPTFGQFLAVLADNGRLALLPEIAALYVELQAEAQRVVKAKITSASQLDAAELAKLQSALKKRFGREVEIETAIDPALLGGAVIDAGDVVIDGSLRNKLARLESALTY
jgi:F-type H+-transporting ATPase subunit delta